MVLRCQFNTCLVKAVFLTMSSMLSWCTKMYKQKFWMCYFGSPSMKRTILWSTGSPIAALKKFQTMQRKDFEFDAAAKTAEKYLNSRGEVAYKGTKALKGTQCPGCTSFSTSFSTLFQNTCSEEKTLFILEGLPLSLDEKMTNWGYMFLALLALQYVWFHSSMTPRWSKHCPRPIMIDLVLGRIFNQVPKFPSHKPISKLWPQGRYLQTFAGGLCQHGAGWHLGRCMYERCGVLPARE